MDLLLRELALEGRHAAPRSSPARRWRRSRAAPRRGWDRPPGGVGRGERVAGVAAGGGEDRLARGRVALDLGRGLGRSPSRSVSVSVGSVSVGLRLRLRRARLGGRSPLVALRLLRLPRQEDDGRSIATTKSAHGDEGAEALSRVVPGRGSSTQADRTANRMKAPATAASPGSCAVERPRATGRQPTSLDRERALRRGVARPRAGGGPAPPRRGLAAGLGRVPAGLAGGRRVLAYDRRGFGSSPRDAVFDAGLFERDADDLAALLLARDAAPAHLVGHSDGATVALVTAYRARARPERDRDRGPRASRSRDAGADARLRAAGGTEGAAWYELWRRGLDEWDIEERMSEIRCPVLVVHDRADPLSPPEHAEAELRAARAGLVVRDGRARPAPRRWRSLRARA